MHFDTCQVMFYVLMLNGNINKIRYGLVEHHLGFLYHYQQEIKTKTVDENKPA